MRLWSLHPCHLDRMGLLAVWRESLLAQAVIGGKTRGYTHHPQLQRFRAHSHPVAAIGAYLSAIHVEAVSRGYSFNADLINDPQGQCWGGKPIDVTAGQLQFEWAHLGEKLSVRSPGDWQRWQLAKPSPHPLFSVKTGLVAAWERGDI